MAENRDGGAAFPWVSHGGVHEHQVVEGGMSLLDWFAGQALAGLLSDTTVRAKPEDFSRTAYKLAAAMLAERARRAEEGER